jgi:hypothetical protein
VKDSKITKPGYREAYNINPAIEADNRLDENENPTGGHVTLYVNNNGDDEYPAVWIIWQSETNADGSPKLKDPNGAFVEDVLWAALQRLEFFNESKYRDRANSIAITKIEEALQALKNRQLERSHRNVEGKHEV